MEQYEINQYITLKLEKDKTVIYVNNDQFMTCKTLLMNIPREQIHLYSKLESIDDLILAHESIEDLTRANQDDNNLIISPKEEFWGHCSNMQAWFENNYDTRLLDSVLAFPLLKKLSELGDQQAIRCFKEEIARRYLTGSFNTKKYLTGERYLNYLSQEELILGLYPKESDLLLDIIELGKQSDLTYKTVMSFDEDKVRHRTAHTERFFTLHKRSLHEIEFDLGGDSKSLKFFRKFTNFTNLFGIELFLGKIKGKNLENLENQPSLESVKWANIYQYDYTTILAIPTKLLTVFPNVTSVNIKCINSENVNLNSLLSLKKLEKLALYSCNDFNENSNKILISLEKKGVKIYTQILK